MAARPARRFAKDRISDPWLAEGVRNTTIGGVAPSWSPRDELDAWPAFDARAAVAATGLPARRIRGDAVSARLAATTAGDPAAEQAIAEVLESESRIAHHGDDRMVLGEHVRAWPLTSVGSLLRGLLLSSGVDADARRAGSRHMGPCRATIPC